MLDTRPEQRQVELRLAAQEATGEARQHAVGQRRHRRDAQHARAARAQLLRGVGDAVEPDERALDLAVEGKRLAGWHQAIALALEQHQFERILQFVHQAADRRLRDVQHLGRACRAARQHHGAERLDLARVQARHGQPPPAGAARS